MAPMGFAAAAAWPPLMALTRLPTVGGLLVSTSALTLTLACFSGPAWPGAFSGVMSKKMVAEAL